LNDLAVIDPVEQMEEMLLPKADGTLQKLPPVQHHFIGGMYIRHMSIPAGLLLMGHTHKTTHPNVLLKGRMRLWMNGLVREIEAPCVFESVAGSRKVAVMLEDVEFATLHATEETDIGKLESELFEASPTWLAYQKGKELCQPQH